MIWLGWVAAVVGAAPGCLSRDGDLCALYTLPESTVTEIRAAERALADAISEGRRAELMEMVAEEFEYDEIVVSLEDGAFVAGRLGASGLGRAAWVERAAARMEGGSIRIEGLRSVLGGPGMLEEGVSKPVRVLVTETFGDSSDGASAGQGRRSFIYHDSWEQRDGAWILVRRTVAPAAVGSGPRGWDWRSSDRRLFDLRSSLMEAEGNLGVAMQTRNWERVRGWLDDGFSATVRAVEGDGARICLDTMGWISNARSRPPWPSWRGGRGEVVEPNIWIERISDDEAATIVSRSTWIGGRVAFDQFRHRWVRADGGWRLASREVFHTRVWSVKGTLVFEQQWGDVVEIVGGGGS